MLDKRSRVYLGYWLLALQLVLVQQCQLSSFVEGLRQEGLALGASSEHINDSFDGESKEEVATGDEESAIKAVLAVTHDSTNLQIVEEKVSPLARLIGGFRAIIQPSIKYTTLIARFVTWNRAYKILQEEYGYNEQTGKLILRDAMDVLRIEYAKLDEKLIGESCRLKEHDYTKKAVEQQKYDPSLDQHHHQDEHEHQEENMDFICKILQLLIVELENKLEVLKREGKAAAEQQSKEDAEAEAEAERMKASFKDASDRVKRIAKNAAYEMVKEEVDAMVNLAIGSTISSYLTNTATGSQILGNFGPVIILLLGSPETPLIMQYLFSIKFRFLFKLAKYSASLFVCGVKNSSPGEVKNAIDWIG